MTSITVYLQDNLPKLNTPKRCHVAPCIDSKVLNNAAEGFITKNNGLTVFRQPQNSKECCWLPTVHFAWLIPQIQH